MQEQRETSGFAIATLITTFIFQPATYFLAYFAAKEIASGEKKGRLLVTTSLVLLAIIPALMAAAALTYFGVGISIVSISLVVLLLSILGVITINKMMREHYFRKSIVIIYLVIFSLLLPVTIASVSYFSVLTPERFVPERCMASAEFSCGEFILQDAGTTLHFELVNNVGNTITVSQATATQANIQGTCEPDTKQLTSLESTMYTCRFAQPVEELQEIEVDGTFKELGKTFDRSFSVSIYVESN